MADTWLCGLSRLSCELTGDKFTNRVEVGSTDDTDDVVRPANGISCLDALKGAEGIGHVS